MSGIPGRRLLYALITLGVIGADQATKQIVRSAMPLYDSLVVIPGVFRLTHVTNRGALFGLLRDLPDPFRSILFTLVPLAAIGFIVYFQSRTSSAEALPQAGLALILGGAFGNLLDRLRLGYVVDFLDFYLGAHHWPAFNLADSSICVGVGLLVLDLLLRGRRADHPAGAGETHDASGPV